MLDVQFRMPPVIANLVNMFYDGELKTGSNCLKKIPMFCGNHLLFVDMKDEPDYREIDRRSDGSNASPYNDKEVEAAVAIATKIREYYKGRIVVITPYKKQKFKLIEGFNKSGCKNIWVNTIDAFQGDEENIVIYCTTRAVKPTKYFSDAARLNVAFSRSKNTLIFLGSSNYLNRYSKDHILRKVSDYLAENAKVIRYKEWLQEDFNLQFVPIEDNPDSVNLGNEVNTAGILPIPSNFFDEINKSSVCTKPTCQVCGKELNEEENILCGECITKYEKHRCKCCGDTVYLSFFDKYVHGDAPDDLCEKCGVATCSECRKEFYVQNDYKQKLLEQGKKLLCVTCQEKFRQIVYCHHCDECGTEITLTYAAKKRILEQGKTLPIVCGECRKKGNEMIQVGVCCVCGDPIQVKRFQFEKYRDTINTNMHKNCSQEVYTWKTCSECYSTFSITYGEKRFFESKGLSLPKKCKSCRKNR